MELVHKCVNGGPRLDKRVGDDILDARHIGQRISARMAELEIDVPTLARALGVSQDSVYKMMRGETVSRWLHLRRLAQALRTSPNALLGFDGDSRGRLTRLLMASFEGLGSTAPQARNYTQTFLEALDKPPNPSASTPEQDELRIEVAFLKRLSERP